MASSVWNNGITDESIKPDRLLECEDCDTYGDEYGYAIMIVDAMQNPPICEAYHPKVNGIGFEFTEFSPMGYPMKVEVQLKFNEVSVPLNFEVEAYPCEEIEIQVGRDQAGNPIYSTEYIRDRPIPGQRGFFHIRTRGGIKGVQGPPRFLSLVHPTRWQYKITEAYVPFAQKMGMWTAFYGLKQNNQANRDNVKSQWTKQPNWDKFIAGDADDVFAYVGPTAMAYDPMPMLEWINTAIAKVTQMNKLMLEGDPAGYLSASETAINNWESKIKKEQTYKRTQFLPIWIALGAKDDTTFKAPVQPTFISLMEGLKAMRDALFGLVEPDDIVQKMNDYLENQGYESKLRPLSKEEIMNQGNNDNTNGGDDENGSIN